MEIDKGTYSRESGTLRVECSGEFGVGTAGNPSGDLLTQAIRRWIAEHKDGPVVEIEIDYSCVDYSWGDGPVSSMVPLFSDGIAKCRIIASADNCGPLKNLLEHCNLPQFELVRIDNDSDEPVLTPVPLKMRVRIPLDETRLSVKAREFAAHLFAEVPEVRNHAHMVTSRSSEECDLCVAVESPTGDEGRRLEISMKVGDREPTVRFGHSGPPAIDGYTIVSLVEGIVHDRVVIGIVVGGRHDGTEIFLDLGDPPSLRNELTAPYSSGRLAIVSWSGSADREVSIEDVGGL